MSVQRPPPPSPRELRRATLPRRALNATEAAIYCGHGEKLFRQRVKAGLAPRPKQIATGRTLLQRWMIDELDAYLDALPRDGDPERASGAPVRRVISL